MSHSTRHSTQVQVATVDFEALIQSFRAPARVWRRSEVLARPSPVPGEPGLYGWYFNKGSLGVPADGRQRYNGAHLLYVGISPSRLPRNTGSSRPNLRKRIRQHYRGNASGSTLRLTLGCILADELGLQLGPAGSTARLTDLARACLDPPVRRHEPLFLSQHRHRVDLRGAPSRYIAGQSRNQQ